MSAELAMSSARHPLSGCCCVGTSETSAAAMLGRSQHLQGKRTVSAFVGPRCIAGHSKQLCLRGAHVRDAVAETSQKDDILATKGAQPLTARDMCLLVGVFDAWRKHVSI